jgi:hypothetical protein
MIGTLAINKNSWGQKKESHSVAYPARWGWKSIQHNTKRACHTVTLPVTLIRILRQKKKNYGNSNISP